MSCFLNRYEQTRRFELMVWGYKTQSDSSFNSLLAPSNRLFRFRLNLQRPKLFYPGPAFVSTTHGELVCRKQLCTMITFGGSLPLRASFIHHSWKWARGSPACRVNGRLHQRQMHYSMVLGSQLSNPKSLYCEVIIIWLSVQVLGKCRHIART